MGSILEDYMKQLKEDKQNEDYSLPEGNEWNETERTEFKKKLDELRNSKNDMENIYKAKKAEMRQLTEKEMTDKELIKDDEVKQIIIKHAYCEDCGEELISQAPPMFNPFTFERVCKHTCSKCGKVYNLEHAYPRVAFIDNNGNELVAFGR